MRCEGKRGYRDDIAADLAAMRIIRKHDADRDDLPIRSYQCPMCRRWHLTHQPYKFWEQEQEADA